MPPPRSPPAASDERRAAVQFAPAWDGRAVGVPGQRCARDRVPGGLDDVGYETLTDALRDSRHAGYTRMMRTLDLRAYHLHRACEGCAHQRAVVLVPEGDGWYWEIPVPGVAR